MAILSANAIRSLVQGVQFEDPRLYDVLMAIIGRMQATDADIADLQSQVTEDITQVTSDTVPPVAIFEYAIFPDYVTLTWQNPSTETVTISNYEIRYGSTWETAVRQIVTNTLFAAIDPLATGTHTYLIKSIDSNGNYSVNAKSLDVIIPAIGAVSITHDVIDNNVLLYWADPTSAFRITHYIVKRNGDSIGYKDGTFTSVFENVAGTNIYSITAVDVVGNLGIETFREVTVSQPPDYVLYSQINADFSGTKTNVVLDSGKLFACVDPSETWTTHFTNNSKTTIQGFVDDGYSYWLETANSTGEYIETLDFGSILTNLIVSVDWTREVLHGSVSVTCYIDISDDNSTWAGYVNGTTLFAASVRYVRIKLTFAGAPKNLIQIYNLSARLDVKLIVDSGVIAALASDGSGTSITFNRSFKDVSSINVSVNKTTLHTVIYDFADVPNPTGFKVFVFNSAGSRADGTVSWIARGIA